MCGQNEVSKWYFGYKAGLNFSTIPPTVLTNSAMRTGEGCASLSDAAGNILFYTKGDTIWNRLHQIMANGTGLIGDQSTSQSAIIVKQPGSNTNYYVFTLASNTQSAGFAYSVVDMALAGTNGSVTVKNSSLFPGPCSEKLTATRHCNGTDIWVVIHEFGTNNFRSFLLTSALLNTVSVISSVGTTHTGGMWAGCMKISPNSKKLALALYEQPGLIELFDFDNFSGTVSNSFTIGAISKAYGCEFSDDGSKLYGTGFVGNTLYQWNLCAGSGTAVAASQFTVSGTSVGQLQRALDKKIYVARSLQQSLGVINSPNSPGTSCNYVDGGQSIAPAQSFFGLPNFLYDVFTGLPKIFSYTVNPIQSCQSVSFSAIGISLVNSNCSSSTSAYNNVEWIFGDPNTGPANTSTLVNPTHVFSVGGTFQVKLVIKGVCSMDTIIQSIVIQSNPNLSVSVNPTICPNQQVTLTAIGADAYHWSTGALSSTISVAPAVTTPFTVSGTNSITGCFSQKVVTVFVQKCTEVIDLQTSMMMSKIYPNPADAFVIIESDKSISIEVCSEGGAKIFEKQIHVGKNYIDITQLPNGVYFVKFPNDKWGSSIKFLKGR